MTSDPELMLAEKFRLVEKQLDRVLPRIDGPESLLASAMQHATLGERQRLHGFLVCAAADLFSVDPVRALRVAAAVECAVAHSTVHDDLPCMDNIKVRWGRKSVHTEFDEATAVLAGDALFALSFELLAEEKTHQDPSVRCQLVTGLSAAAGGHGTVGGQWHDLHTVGGRADIGEIIRLQQMKSGALITFSCEAGGILGHATRESRLALRAFAHDLGLAQQIISDIQSLEHDDGAEKPNRNASFATVLGPERARTQAKILASQSLQHIDIFGENAKYLSLAVDYIMAQNQ